MPINSNPSINKAVNLDSVSKKYPIPKKGDKDMKEYFDDFWALKDVTFDLKQGEILGIIGRNGAGKTTLLNIIAGILSPTQGKVNVEGKTLGLFNLGVGFQDALSGRENIFLNGTILGATSKELEGKLSLIIEFSELGNFINMPLGSYSQGMRLRLGFSIIANLNFDILLVDEVLAVGDALFQNKCFERMMDFKRAGKTLIMTTQSLDLIERLSDNVVLFDHGRLLFHGQPSEGINKYRALLNTDKFFVGPAVQNTDLVENTKKWADNISDFGKKFGTREIIIDSAEFINKFGIRINSINSGDSLKLKVKFTARNDIKEPHFGVAIFRSDGVYCYGPNTEFDGYIIPGLRQGRGYFILDYRRLLLAPGDYKVSIAIWDKKETLAFDYHYGCYELTVIGYSSPAGELLNISYKIINAECNRGFNLFRKIKKPILNLQMLNNKWEQSLEQRGAQPVLLKLVNKSNEEKAAFTTNETVNCVIDLGDSASNNKNYYLWLAFYRDDRICCQNIIYHIGKNPNIEVFFQKFPLLPGGYRVSYGIWDNSLHKFIVYHHGIYKFKMVFQHQDHGTVFLDHNWRYKLPK